MSPCPWANYSLLRRASRSYSTAGRSRLWTRPLVRRGGSQADPIWFLSSDSVNRFRLEGEFRLTNGGAIKLQ